jgi:hypothetical protein
MAERGKGYAAKKGERFKTRSGFTTVGDEIQALMNGDQIDRPRYAMQIWISPDLAELIAVEASERGMTPPELARAILDAVTSDNLFAAVLDG